MSMYFEEAEVRGMLAGMARCCATDRQPVVAGPGRPTGAISIRRSSPKSRPSWRACKLLGEPFVFGVGVRERFHGEQRLSLPPGRFVRRLPRQKQDPVFSVYHFCTASTGHPPPAGQAGIVIHRGAAGRPRLPHAAAAHSWASHSGIRRTSLPKIPSILSGEVYQLFLIGRQAADDGPRDNGTSAQLPRRFRRSIPQARRREGDLAQLKAVLPADSCSARYWPSRRYQGMLRGQGIALSGVGPVNRSMGGTATNLSSRTRRAPDVEATASITASPALRSRSGHGNPLADRKALFELCRLRFQGSNGRRAGSYADPEMAIVHKTEGSPWTWGVGIFGIAGYNRLPGEPFEPRLNAHPPNGIGLGPHFLAGGVLRSFRRSPTR